MEYTEGQSEIRERREDRRLFRVAIFGTGSDRSEQDKEATRIAAEVGSLAIEQGYSIATGGYNKGVMAAASEAAVQRIQELELGQADELVKAHILDERLGEPVQGAEVSKSATLIQRLGRLIDETSAFIILGGATGTIVEMVAALHSERAQRAMKNEKTSPRPLVIIDPSLKHTDLLAILSRMDTKLRKDKLLDDIYVLGNVQNINGALSDILDSYYKLGRGEKVDDVLTDKLRQMNMKNFLDAQANFNEGGGI